MSVVIYRPVLSDSYRTAGDDPTGEEAKAVAKQTCLAAIQAAKDAVSEWEAATLRFLQPVNRQTFPPTLHATIEGREKKTIQFFAEPIPSHAREVFGHWDSTLRDGGPQPTGILTHAIVPDGIESAAINCTEKVEIRPAPVDQPVTPPPDAPVELSDRDKAIVIAAVLSTLGNAHSERIAELEAARDGLEGALRDAIHEQMRMREETSKTLDVMAKSLDAKSAELEAMRAERDAARKEADELRAKIGRADRFLQEHTTLLKQLEEQMRQADQWVESLVDQIQKRRPE